MLKLTKIVFTVLIFTIISCTKPPISTNTSGRGFEVGFLFENEGCKLYRFTDAGRHIYYTNCSSTTYSEYCGKNCVRQVNVDTNRGN